MWEICHVGGDIEVVYKDVVVHMVGGKVYRHFGSIEVYGMVLEGLVVEGCVWGISHILGFDIHIGESLARCSMKEVFAMSIAHTQLNHVHSRHSTVVAELDATQSSMQIIEVPVVIVGAGPAGIATAGCLNKLKIFNIVLEKDDCPVSLWRKRAYDRLKLHLGKDFCSLPHYPFPSDFPNFVPRVDFLRYIDSYIAHFGIDINYNCSVDSAFIDQSSGKWRLLVTNNSSGAGEIYEAEFLVVASGENSEEYIPNIKGLENYQGESMHCSKYLNGREMYKKNVLVVGCGNSGMEIAYDLSTWGAYTSIVIRSQVHYFSKEMVYAGMLLLKHFTVEKVDKIMIVMSKLKYGNMSKYGLMRPKEGPFALKIKGGTTPTIDVGCVEKIKKGKVKVYPDISSIKEGKVVKFVDGQHAHFDAIIFATGYKTNVLKWLKDYKGLFNENGMPKPSYPNHWKGEHGIYNAGFSRRGLEGISFDAMKIANDINFTLTSRVNQITS
ncbi:probable indole-3-pyruvate monooxygenase YUCCA11 [Arachis hypogaea]|uniref:probable indole-3-pyruvate monooxygenase YUCCA11 n=1 Tax=Arachis hypogaea TaxID=3818 RepID=UPI003B21007B